MKYTILKIVCHEAPVRVENKFNLNLSSIHNQSPSINNAIVNKCLLQFTQYSVTQPKVNNPINTNSR